MTSQPTATDRRALALVREAESSGRRVRRVVIEGKRVEIEFVPDKDDPGEFQLTDMRR
jgi:hypothetical protein